MNLSHNLFLMWIVLTIFLAILLQVTEIEQKTDGFGLDGLLHLDRNSDTTGNKPHILCVSKCPV